jgi:hypothetical protein
MDDSNPEDTGARKAASENDSTAATQPDKAGPEDAIYDEVETGAGTRMIPSPLAGGPWNPKHQHGGAVSGLLAHALDRLEAPSPMRLSRITIEMFRAVPLRPLRVETEITRGGRRIQSVEASLFDDDVQVARATGLRVRRDESLSELFTAAPLDPGAGAPPSGIPKRRQDLDMKFAPAFLRAVDIQSETPKACGTPATLWTRLRCRFMAGEETSPVIRLATLVDFASGTGNAMDYDKFTSINPDLSIHVLREPTSEWIAIRGTTLRSADGIGQSSAAVYDLDGLVARVQATLLVDRL